MVSVSANIWANNGWPWRIPSDIPSPDLVAPELHENEIKELNRTKWNLAYTIGPQRGAKNKVLVIGDSHAEHLLYGAKYLSKKYHISFTFYTFTGCPPVFGTYKIYNGRRKKKYEGVVQKKCREQTQLWEDYVRANKFDFVILSSRWNWLFEPAVYYDTQQRADLLVDKSDPKFSVNESKKTFSRFLDYTVQTIQQTGARAIIFGQVPNSGKDLEGCDNVPRLLISEKNINKRCNHIPKNIVLDRSKFSNKIIKDVAYKNNAIAVITTDFFCKKEDEYCTTFYKGTRLKNDASHINKYGSVFLVKQWERSDNFPFTKPSY